VRVLLSKLVSPTLSRAGMCARCVSKFSQFSIEVFWFLIFLSKMYRSKSLDNAPSARARTTRLDDGLFRSDNHE